MAIRIKSYSLFLIVNGLFCLLFILVFKPIVFESLGDASDYIDFAKQIYHFPNATLANLSHRSPLYSILIGLFMLIFGENSFVLPVFVFQYMLLFLTSIVIYKIILLLVNSRKTAFIGGLLSTLNLSTIFYAFNILSETISLFLFSLFVLQIFKFFKEGKLINLFVSGMISALLVLARFNAIGIPFVLILILLFYFAFRFDINHIKKQIVEMVIMITPIILILNAWAFYNYVNNGFYSIIPASPTVQRWAIPATINEKNTVSPQYKEVLNIFLANEKKQKQNITETKLKKGSLLSNPLVANTYSFFSPEINGYKLYKDSEKQLLEFYKLPFNSKGTSQLNILLAPFYNEIAFQNKQQLLKLKVLSFIYTFKSNSPTLPGENNLNLNSLPTFMLVSYKLIFIFSMIFVYFISLIHGIEIIWKKQFKSGINWLALYCFLWYFPLINFYANVLGDANRFKYPAESLILGLFVCYMFFVVQKIQAKWNNLKLARTKY